MEIVASLLLHAQEGYLPPTMLLVNKHHLRGDPYFLCAAPGPVVSGVLRTPDGVINLGPKAKLRLRKAAALLK